MHDVLRAATAMQCDGIKWQMSVHTIQEQKRLSIWRAKSAEICRLDSTDGPCLSSVKCERGTFKLLAQGCVFADHTGGLSRSVGPAIQSIVGQA